MINGLSNKIECEICGGTLTFSPEATMDDYAIAVTADTVNVFDRVEEIIGKYLVYECPICHAKYKYTYKDLEKSLRKDLTQRTLMLVVHGNIINSNAILDKFFFYCGKCNGYTGTGCCPKSMYNKCEIKRFPLNEP